MTVVRTDEEGLRAAGRALDAGSPIVVPVPTPLAYVVAGSDAAEVNVAKGRPAGQPAGMAVADFSAVTPHVDLDEATLAFARWLTAHELLNLMLPVRDGCPAWLWPSTSRGWLGLTLCWLERLRPLLDGRGHLYLSSANRTGNAVAVTAGAANAEFGGELLVLDGDAARDPSVASGSATIVRVRPGRQLELLRRGVHDAPYEGEDDRFLHDLARRWTASGGS